MGVKKFENSNPKVVGIRSTWPEYFYVTGVSVGTSTLTVTDKQDNVEVFEITITGAVDGTRKIVTTVGTGILITTSTKKDLKKVENPNSKVVDIRGGSRIGNEIYVTAIGVGNSVLRLTDLSDHVDVIEFIVAAESK